MSNYSNHPQKNTHPIIKADNLHKTYLFGLEGVAALRGVSFEIKQGDFIIILGNSGGGKTSLLNILGTIDKQTKVTIASHLGESRIVRIKDKGKNNRWDFVRFEIELFGFCVPNFQSDLITDCKTECWITNDSESNFI